MTLHKHTAKEKAAIKAREKKLRAGAVAQKRKSAKAATKRNK